MFFPHNITQLVKMNCFCVACTHGWATARSGYVDDGWADTNQEKHLTENGVVYMKTSQSLVCIFCVSQVICNRLKTDLHCYTLEEVGKLIVTCVSVAATRRLFDQYFCRGQFSAFSSRNCHRVQFVCQNRLLSKLHNNNVAHEITPGSCYSVTFLLRQLQQIMHPRRVQIL